MSRIATAAALVTMFLMGYVTGWNRGHERGGRAGIDATIAEVERLLRP